MKLSVLALCVLGACSMSAYASTTNIVNAQSQFLMSHNGNKDDSSNVRKNGSYCETRTLNIVHNFEQDKTYQGVGIKKIDKVTGTYQTVCVKDGKQTFAPPYTQTYVNDITYEYQCTRRSEEKFEHYASDCVTSKNIYSNGVVGNDVRLMRFRGEENTDRSYSGIPSYESVVNSCNAMTLESRGTPVDACPIPIGAEGKQDIIRIEDISTQNNVATIRITDNKNTTDATATINYKSTKINLSKEWLDQLERVTIKNAKAKDWMFVTLKNPAGANAGVEPILQMPYVGNSAEPPQLHLCNNLQRFNWGANSVSGSKVQDLSLIFNGIAGYKNISTTGNLSISQYPCEVNADSSGVNLAKARFPIVQGRHWEMNGGSLSATWDTPEVVNRYNGVIPIHNGQIVKDFQTRECKDPYLPREDKEICKLGDDLAPFIYNESNRRQGVAGSGLFKVYRKNDILPLLLQGFNNIEILTIGRDKNMELTLEFTFKGNKPSISKKIKDDKKNCYGRGHDASCHEQDNENDNNTGGNNPMVPPHKDPNVPDGGGNYIGWTKYKCYTQWDSAKGTQDYEDNVKKCINEWDYTKNISEDLIGGTAYPNDFGVDERGKPRNHNTGIFQKEHDEIMQECNTLLESYENRLGSSILQKDSPQQRSCRLTAHNKYRGCLENHHDNYDEIKKCFEREKTNVSNYAPVPLSEPLIDKYCSQLTAGEAECRTKFTSKYKGYTCPTVELSNCISSIINEIKSFKTNSYYDSNKTTYDGWFSYVCADQQECIRDFKKDYEKLSTSDLEDKLKNKIIGGLQSGDNQDIINRCKNRGEGLQNKNSQYLDALCTIETTKKYQNCLKENKSSLQAIQTCFNDKKKEIHYWYDEVYISSVVREGCNLVSANNTKYLEQCINQYNNPQFIKGFMNSFTPDLNKDPIHLTYYEDPLKNEIQRKFKPTETNANISNTGVANNISTACQKKYEHLKESGLSKRAITGCKTTVERQYNECKERGNAASCNARIQEYVNNYRH